MQIHDNQQPTGGSNANTQYSAEAHPDSVTAGLFAIDDPGLQGPITGNNSTGLLKILTEKLKKEFEPALESRPNLRVDFITQDNNTDKTYYSTITVVLSNKDARRAAVYTLLLEATNDAPRSRIDNIAGANVEVFVPAGEAYDQDLRDRIAVLVKQAFQQTELVPVGGVVVPRIFNVDDDVAVRNLARQCSDATYTALLEASSAYQGINLAAAKNDSTLRVGVTFNRQVYIDKVSMPVRSDLQVEFSAQSTDQSKSLNNQMRRGETISRAHAYVDILYAPIKQQNTGWGVQQTPTQIYVPNIVVTHLENTKATTLAAHLLSMITTLAAAAQDDWVNTFWKRTGDGEDRRGGVDWTDIGFLNYEANVSRADTPVEINTRLDSFDHRAFSEYAHLLFRPEPIFSFDIPFNGANTYALGTLLWAARGSKDHIRLLIDECDRFTGGGFSRHYVGELAADPMFKMPDNIQLKGYYTNSAGHRRPLDDIDYLAVVNQFIAKDRSYVTMWSDSFFRPDLSIERKLDDRRKIIVAMAASAVFTDYALRVTPSAGFLTALTRAAKDAGLTTTLTTGSGSALRGHERVSAYDSVHGAALNGGYQPIFTAAQTPGFGNQGGRSQYWG